MTDLDARLRKAAQHKMTPDEIKAQKRSWVRGMTTPCEHGVVDFECCEECIAELEDKTDE